MLGVQVSLKTKVLLKFVGEVLSQFPSFLSADQPIQYAHSTFEDGVAKLTVQDALPEDDGIYTCLAENNRGQASCSAQVTVKGEYCNYYNHIIFFNKNNFGSLTEVVVSGFHVFSKLFSAEYLFSSLEVCAT